jgi:hypothetical protein
MEKRILVRISYEKLDLAKLTELIEALEELADQYGDAQVEYSILPELPRA